MQFSDSILEEIKARINLSDIVGRYVTWDRRKSQPSRQDYWACCPFHNEKTPSFHVDDRRQIYKCFGCEAGGGHFQFLMQKEGLSFPEAVERLASESGVALPTPDPKFKEKEKVKATLADVCEMACQYFESELKSANGAQARDYLQQRGFGRVALSEFRVGYATDGRDNLQRHLRAKGVEESSMLEAGLIGKPEDGGSCFDRFRNRIIIPIHDERGRVVAFGGRSLDPDGMPKYLNSPETPLFQKRFMLFNFHRARQHAFDSKTAIVVEGYMDAIAIWQAGIKHVVASLGTAFTEQQIAKMWRLAPEPTICFDGDSAGVKAAYRAIDRTLPELKGGHSFYFSLLPAGQDPDDLIREKGVTGFLEELKNSMTLSDLLWEREIEGKPIDTPERKASLEKSLYGHVAQIKDETVRRGYRLDIRLRLSNYFWKYNREVYWSGSRSKKNVLDTPGGKRVTAPTSSLFGHERTFCALCVKNLDLLVKHIERILPLQFADELHQQFKSELCRLAIELAQESVADIFNQLDKRFYQILSEVMSEDWENEAEIRLNHRDRFFQLKQRLPVLNLDPEPAFLEKLFLLYLEKLELRSFERVVLNESSTSDGELREEDWGRIQALSVELERNREIHRRNEEDLAEQAAKLRHSHEDSEIPTQAAQIGA